MLNTAGTVKNATHTLNSDGSWGYSVELTKTLQEEDEGHNVTCKVTPQIGQPVIRSETLTIFGKLTVSINCTVTFKSRVLNKCRSCISAGGMEVLN